MSRHWHRVSKPIQKMAAALYPIMSEGMSPYEIYYVLATDEEIQRLNELSATMVVHWPGVFESYWTALARVKRLESLGSRSNAVRKL